MKEYLLQLGAQAVLLLAFASTGADAARGNAGGGYRYARPCDTSSCRDRYPDGYRTVPHDGSYRRGH